MKRVIKKFGSEEKAYESLKTFQELENNRKPVGCVHDTADGFIIAMIECGFSQIELWSWFKIGGFRVQRLKAEMKDPTFHSKKIGAKNTISCF